LLLAVITLLAGLWGGLLRMGWQLPPIWPTLVPQHGPLMVCGFLGMLIGLERAVAMGRVWACASPLLCGLGAVLAVAGTAGVWPSGLFLAGSVVLFVVMVVLTGRQKALSMYVMALGAAVWVAGNSLWVAGRPVFEVSLWWAGFLVLTIMGERWGFSRIQAPARGSKWLFGISVVAAVAGLVFAQLHRHAGTIVLGVGLMLMSDWLLVYDISRRTLRRAGSPRYVAVSIQTGALWLGIGGLLMVFFGRLPAGAYYDAVLHCLFVGYVFSMIFGHAPLVLPEVLRLPFEFNRSLYVPLILLHGSLVVRIAGDLLDRSQVRAWGGKLNAVAIVLFFVVMMVSVIRSRKTS
jgi:hypothetical protein